MGQDVPRHQTEVDPTNHNNSDSQLTALVGSAPSVLLVGCGTGAVARALLDAGCQVTGVDRADRLDPTTRGRLKDLVVADLGSTRLGSLLAPATFDAVVLDTVLHSVPDPAAVAADARGLVNPDGVVVVSVPNATHGAVRLDALRGGVEPPETRGLSGDAVCTLLEGADLIVDTYRATMLDPLDPLAERTPLEPGSLPPGVVEWVRHQPQALCFQFVLRARPASPDVPPVVRPRLEQLVSSDVVRRTDEFTDERRREDEKRRALLVQRDHVLGLEARNATSAARKRQAEERAERLEARAKRLKLQLVQLAEAVDKMPRGRGQRRVRQLVDEVRPGRGVND